MAPSQLEAEIQEQPAALARLLDEGRDPVHRAAERIARFAPEWVTIAARGSSDNAARYAQIVLGAHNGLVVALAAPSLHTIYAAPPRLARALVVGISVSGQSPDVVSVVADGRRQGAATLALTADRSSPLARAAEHVLALSSGPERSVAATKSYTNQLLSLAMLSAALDGDAARWDELGAVPDAASRALATPIDLDATPALATTARTVVLGRGFNYATAHELALKMKETSYLLAEPYSPADLLHGPIAMLEPGFPVVLVAPSGKAVDPLDPLLERLAADGVRLIALSDRDELLDRAHARVPLPHGVPEWLSPISTIVAGQRWAVALARALGRDPDRPRGLTKVTRTS